MKLNKILSSIALASTLLSTGAMAADGTIAFTGTVTASACTAVTGVSVSGGAATLNPTIALPTVPASAFTTTGTYLGHTAFQIKLTGCAAAGSLSNVRTLFDTTFAPPSDPYVAGNTDTGATAATNVAIALLTPAGAQINMNDTATSPNIDPGTSLPATSGAVNLDYVAVYKSIGTTVGAGTVAATANYTISYF